jgi:hypothetical protein
VPALFPTVCSSAPGSPGNGSVILMSSTSNHHNYGNSFVSDELDKPLLDTNGVDLKDIETPV